MMNEPNTENLPVQGEQPSSNSRLFSELAKRMPPMASMGSAGGMLGGGMAQPAAEQQPSYGLMGGAREAIGRGIGGGSMVPGENQGGGILGRLAGLMGCKKPGY